MLFAHRDLARLGSEIFLSSLQSGFFINLLGSKKKPRLGAPSSAQSIDLGHPFNRRF
jgi:hypothetical protein